MGTCVECVCYVAKREWVFLFPQIIERCANPKNMMEDFDHVTGKAALAYCYAHNKDGKCKQFMKSSEP